LIAIERFPPYGGGGVFRRLASTGSATAAPSRFMTLACQYCQRHIGLLKNSVHGAITMVSLTRNSAMRTATNIMIYWVTNTIDSSAHRYFENTHSLPLLG